MRLFSRTATEQLQRLERQEHRTVIEQLRAETASLQPDSRELHDAASMLSMDPSVNLEVDSILLRHPAYRKVYGHVGLSCSYMFLTQLNKLQYHVHRPAVVSLPTKDGTLTPSPVTPCETPNLVVKEVIQERHYQHRLQQLNGTAFNRGEKSNTHQTSWNEPQNLHADFHQVDNTTPSNCEKFNDIEREQGDLAYINGRSNELGSDEPASNNMSLDLLNPGSGLGVDFTKDVFNFEGSKSGARDGKISSPQSFSHLQNQKDIRSNSSGDLSYNADHETNQNMLKSRSIAPETRRNIRSPSIETDLYEASIQPRRSREHIEIRYQTAEIDPFDDPHTASSPNDIDPSSVTLELADKNPSSVNPNTEALQNIPTVYDHYTDTPYVILDL